MRYSGHDDMPEDYGSGHDGGGGQSVLVLGDIDGWHRAGRALPGLPGLVFARVADFNKETLNRLSPDVIISPLVDFCSDAFDIAQVLSKAAFRGRYMIVTGDLPLPDMVHREIAESAPDVDIHVLNGSALKVS